MKTPAKIFAATVMMYMGCRYLSLEDHHARHRRELAPAIKFVDSYISTHGKLPNQRTFQKWADDSGAHMLIIWDRSHKYAEEHGAKTDTDYMVGTWTADWYYYYRSWDKQYFDAPDDTDTGFVYD